MRSEVPVGWRLVHLGDVAEVRSGVAKNTNRALMDPVEVPYLRVANVQDGYLDLSDIKTINIERSEFARYALCAGDVLMNEGGDIDKLGRGAVWRGQIPSCVHQNHVFSVRCGDALIPDYLSAVGESSIGKSYFLEVGKQTTNLASINKTLLQGLPVPLPPLPEQKKIAAILSSVDEAILATQAVIDQTRRVKEGLLQDLLTRGIDHTRFKQTEIGEIPEAWEVRLFGDMVEAFIDYRGRTPKKLNLDWSATGIPAISAVNVRPGRLDLTDCNYGSEELYRLWMQNGDCRRGDVLLTMEAPLGNVALVPDDGRYILSQRVLLIRPIGAVVYAEYLAQLMQATAFQRELDRRSTGTTAKGIQRARLVLIPVAIPPLAEQTAIQRLAQAVDRDLSCLLAVIGQQRQTKSALLQDLLTGRVRVTP